MTQLLYLLFLIVLLPFSYSCQNSTEFNAIRDYRKSLRPYLTNLVSAGIVGLEDSSTRYIRQHATDQELLKLTRSEHPLLRTVALREILDRPSMEHYQLIMSKLSDTALVPTDQGEFGIYYKYVSDDMLEYGKWKNFAKREKTFNEIIKNHNYLISAYEAVERMQLTNQQHPYIRQMVIRYGDPQPGIRYQEFWRFEKVLLALAKFQRKEDIPLIAQTLEKNFSRIGEKSFLLMQIFQNDSYLELLDKYYHQHYYFNLCDPYEGYPEYFINAIASYKNEKSRGILEEMMYDKDLKKCQSVIGIKYSLFNAIWNNNCSTYSKLVKKIRLYVMSQKVIITGHYLDTGARRIPVDMTKGGEPITWSN